jgi:hypothetical protein
MGIIASCACKRPESEEEFISKIFNSMLIQNLDVNETYKEFLSCIIDGKIDKNLYLNFVCKIVNPLQFREPQADFFDNLLEINDVKINGIKRIGAIIIFLSNGSYSEKITLLEKHISKYYGKMDKHVKDFISDMIEMNTDMCLLAFRTYLDLESHKSLALIWKKHRKQKLIMKIYTIYEELKSSYERDKEGDSSLLKKFLNTSYSNLLGENIRTFLYEEYVTENNKFLKK